MVINEIKRRRNRRRRREKGRKLIWYRTIKYINKRSESDIIKQHMARTVARSRSHFSNVHGLVQRTPLLMTGLSSPQRVDLARPIARTTCFAWPTVSCDVLVFLRDGRPFRRCMVLPSPSPSPHLLRKNKKNIWRAGMFSNWNFSLILLRRRVKKTISYYLFRVFVPFGRERKGKIEKNGSPIFFPLIFFVFGRKKEKRDVFLSYVSHFFVPCGREKKYPITYFASEGRKKRK